MKDLKCMKSAQNKFYSKSKLDNAIIRIFLVILNTYLISCFVDGFVNDTIGSFSNFLNKLESKITFLLSDCVLPNVVRIQISALF
jgi:hypothetical protein